MGSALLLGAAGAIVFLWASVYSAIHIALADFSSGQLAFLRLAIGSVTLAGWGVLTQTPLPERRHWPGLALIGLIGFAAYLVLLNLGQRAVEAGTASFIINTTPALSAVLAAVFLGERLRSMAIAGVVLSLCGVAVIAFKDGDGLRFDYSLGALLLLCAAIVHAIHFVYQKAMLAEVSPFAVTLGSMVAGAMCLLPFAPGACVAMLHASPRGLIVVLHLGILCSAFAHLAWSHLLAHLSASRDQRPHVEFTHGCVDRCDLAGPDHPRSGVARWIAHDRGRRAGPAAVGSVPTLRRHALAPVLHFWSC
jgi:drug/metabolite transporter (DMT)-like permease